MDVDAKPKQTKAATGPKVQTKKEPMTPEEKARMEARIRAKVACDKAAYDVQMLLIEPGISDEALRCAAEVLQPHHYNDIVEERALDGLCGFPSCSAVAPSKGQGKKLHISLSAHKVYDISTLHNFCGRECAAQSRRYAETLQSTSLFLRTGSSDAAVKAVAAVKAAIAGAPAAAEAAASIAAMDISDSAASASDATTVAAAIPTTAAMPPPLAPCSPLGTYGRASVGWSSRCAALRRRPHLWRRRRAAVARGAQPRLPVAGELWHHRGLSRCLLLLQCHQSY